MVPSAFEQLKEEENIKIKTLELKHEQDMKSMREEIQEDMKKQIAQLMVNLKPEILKQGLV